MEADHPAHQDHPDSGQVMAKNTEEEIQPDVGMNKQEDMTPHSPVKAEGKAHAS